MKIGEIGVCMQIVVRYMAGWDPR